MSGQSKTIQGICSHRYNLRLVSFGYSLSNVFNRRIDNAKPIFLILFGVIIISILFTVLWLDVCTIFLQPFYYIFGSYRLHRYSILF